MSPNPRHLKYILPPLVPGAPVHRRRTRIPANPQRAQHLPDKTGCQTPPHIPPRSHRPTHQQPKPPAPPHTHRPDAVKTIRTQPPPRSGHGRMQKGFAYECSAALPSASTNGRRGMESFFLYRSPCRDARSCIAFDSGNASTAVTSDPWLPPHPILAFAGSLVPRKF